MKKTIISILLLACLALGLCSCAGGEKMKNGIKEFGDGAKDALDDVFAYETSSYGMTISLCSAEATSEATSEALATKQLVATINTAYIKSMLVDWEVYWLTNPYEPGTPVTDYVNVVPLSDGSLTANVECYQAFSRDGIVGVRCTTREGGYWAECKVTFIGHPTSLGFSLNGSAVTAAPTLEAEAEYVFDLTLVNPFADVNPEYSPSYTLVNYGVAGEIEVLSGHFSSGRWGYGVVNRQEYASTFTSLLFPGAVLEAGKLTVDVGIPVQEIMLCTDEVNNQYVKYTSGYENVHYYVTVQDTISGLTQTLYFYVGPNNSDVINVSPDVSF